MAAQAKALVTGASRGIGRAVAEALAAAGYGVLGVGRDAAALDQVRVSGVEPVVAELTNAAEIAELAVRAGDVEVLVHCAGVLRDARPFQEVEPEAIDAMVGVNVVAPLRLTRAMLPGMIARGRGHLFFLGSSGGRHASPNAAAYGASKAALGLFCDALRADLLGTGLRVTEVVPGRVETTLYHGILGAEEARTRLYEGYRTIPATAIAELVLTALKMPPEVDVSRIEVYPTDQASAGFRMAAARDGNA